MKAQVPPGMRIIQVAVVVRDLRKTMGAYHRVLDWGPWSVYEHKPPILHHQELHGKPVNYSMLGAEVHCDPIDFEILQPLDGPSIGNGENSFAKAYRLRKEGLDLGLLIKDPPLPHGSKHYRISYKPFFKRILDMDRTRPS